VGVNSRSDQIFSLGRLLRDLAYDNHASELSGERWSLYAFVNALIDQCLSIDPIDRVDYKFISVALKPHGFAILSQINLSSEVSHLFER
jgi:hypothetical protein